MLQVFRMEQLEGRRLLATVGTGTVAEGAAYSLDLSLFDRGSKPLAGWAINWGDGVA